MNDDKDERTKFTERKVRGAKCYPMVIIKERRDHPFAVYIHLFPFRYSLSLIGRERAASDSAVSERLPTGCSPGRRRRELTPGQV